MSRPCIPAQLSHPLDYTGPQWIKMDVPGKFQKIGIIFTYNGFVPVLKKMSITLVPPIKVYYIAG